jgi:hypothetical protein
MQGSGAAEGSGRMKPIDAALELEIAPFSIVKQQCPYMLINNEKPEKKEEKKKRKKKTQEGGGEGGKNESWENALQAPVPATSSEAFFRSVENVNAKPSQTLQFEEIFRKCPYVEYIETGTNCDKRLTPAEHAERMRTHLFRELIISDADHESELLYEAGPRLFSGSTSMRLVPPCSSGSKCIGCKKSLRVVPRKNQLGSGSSWAGGVLGIYLTPEEKERLIRQGIAPGEEQRLCVLCERARVMETQVAIMAGYDTTKIDPKFIVQMYRNPSDGPGAYNEEDLLRPDPGNKWCGMSEPVVMLNLSKLYWEYNEAQGMWRVDQRKCIKKYAHLFQTGAI